MNSLELFERRDELRHIVSELRDELKNVEEQISDLYLNMAKDHLRADGKDFGTAHVVDGNQRIKVTISKKVEWDEEALRDVLNGMQEEDARHYAKVKISVEERKFTAAPPEVKRKLESCRTVKAGTVKIEVEDK